MGYFGWLKVQIRRVIFPKNMYRKLAKTPLFLLTELPDTSFTRSISNPEAVMRRRRQQKLEKKLQQFRGKDGDPDSGGALKIYGEALCKDVPYKTLLVSVQVIWLITSTHVVEESTLLKPNFGTKFKLVFVAGPRLLRGRGDAREVRPQQERGSQLLSRSGHDFGGRRSAASARILPRRRRVPPGHCNEPHAVSVQRYGNILLYTFFCEIASRLKVQCPT